MLATVGRARDVDLAVAVRNRDVAVDPLRERPLRAGHVHRLRLDRHRDAVGNGDGLAADARHRYQTSATTSPPIPCLRASWPVRTPCEVDTIAVPIPPCTFGMPEAGT